MDIFLFVNYNDLITMFTAYDYIKKNEIKVNSCSSKRIQINANENNTKLYNKLHFTGSVKERCAYI